MKKEPEKIGNFIMDSIAKMGLTTRLEKQSAVVDWAKIVGDAIAAESEAIRIDGDILIVRVHRAAWRQQLVFLKTEILTKLDEKIGKDLIKDIRFI